MQQRRAQIQPVGAVAPVHPDHRHAVFAQHWQQPGERADRLPGRAHIHADMGQPTLGRAEIVLHVDDDEDGAREVERDRLGHAGDRDRAGGARRAAEIHPVGADPPAMRRRRAEVDQAVLWLIHRIPVHWWPY